MQALLQWRFVVHSRNTWQALSHSCFSSTVLQKEKTEKCWQISSHGRCRSLYGTVSTGYLRPCGYHKVNIQGQQFYVHRLVAVAFLGSPDPLAWQVHHKDGDKSNNHVDNLEYVTPAQNISLSYASPARGSAGRGLSMPVMWRAVGSESWQTSPSMVEAARHTGVSQPSVRKSCDENIPVRGFEFCLAKLAEQEPVEGEVWRQMLDPRTGTAVPGTMVSSFGRLHFANGRISTGHQVKNGYHTAKVSSRLELLHRLVAFAFLGPPPTQQHIYVNHKDYDKSNNAVDNLDYVTASENAIHSHANAARRRPTSNVKPVESRPNIGSGEWTWHSSMVNAARMCGVSDTLVRFHACNSRSHAGKFEFRFAQMESTTSRPGEEWRDVDVTAHLQERLLRRSLTWYSGLFRGQNVRRKDLIPFGSGTAIYLCNF